MTITIGHTQRSSSDYGITFLLKGGERTITPMEEIYTALKLLIEELHKASRETDRLRQQADTANAWVATHGEIVTKSEAASILRVSRGTIYEMIDRGDIKTSPDGRVLVRSMADWATGKKEKKPKKRQC